MLVSSQANAESKNDTMTKDDIIKMTYWRNENLLEGKVYSNFTESEVIIHIGFSQFDTDREISDFSVKSLNDFLELDKSNIDWIKNESTYPFN